MRWDAGAFFADPQWTRSDPGIVGSFVALGDASGPRIRTFAARWGMLDLCIHQLPVGHPMRSVPSCLGETRAETQTLHGPCRSLFGLEPLDSWRFWARQARAIVDLGASLRAGGRGDPNRWRDLFEQAPWAMPFSALRAAESSELPSYVARQGAEMRGPLAPLGERRRTITDAIDFWMAMSSIRLSLRWPRGRPESEWTDGGLFGALGLQMLFTVSSAMGWAVCAGCGAQHVPSRPNSRRRSYCPTCRATGVRQRLASSDYRRRKLASRASNA